MRSRVAEETRRARVEEERALSPTERVRLAFELGARDATLLASAAGLTTAEAARRIRASHAAGRRRSVAAEP